MCAIAVCAYTNLELLVRDLFTMCPSPSKIPTKTSFISLGIVIIARSTEDKRIIPLVERATYNIQVDIKLMVI